MGLLNKIEEQSMMGSLQSGKHFPSQPAHCSIEPILPRRLRRHAGGVPGHRDVTTE